MEIKLTNALFFRRKEILQFIMRTFIFLYQEDIFKNMPKVHLKNGVIKVNKLLRESLSSGIFLLLTAFHLFF